MHIAKMKILDKYIELLFGYTFLIWWFVGIVYADGYLKILAAIFPPYAMYLVIEKVLIVNGLV